MDGRCSQSASSDSKKLKCSTEDTNVDRISGLPETILHHILSFFNMKHAVKTCVLSRRWRNLWASLPFLNFDKELSNKTRPTCFRDFVDHVLLQRDNACIQRFHLDCHRINRLNAWILYSLKHNVQELSIVIRDGWNSQELQLLHGLFTCTSLKVLELNTNAQLKYILPHTVNLPVLQTLVFHGLSIVGDEFDKLFFACPTLESLTIENCGIQSAHLSISSSKLRQLVIDYDFDEHVFVRGVVNIYAPNLLSFRCRDNMLTDYSLENLSSLVKADIFLGREGGLSANKVECYTVSIMEILRAVQNVTTLTLSASGSIFQIFSEAFQGTQFCNLRYLKFCAIHSTSCKWIKTFTYLLKISPNIETISLTGDMSDSTDIGDYRKAGLSMRNLKHLKFVSFKDTSGGLNKIKYLENILKNGGWKSCGCFSFIYHTHVTTDSRVTAGLNQKLRTRTSNHLFLFPCQNVDHPSSISYTLCGVIFFFFL